MSQLQQPQPSSFFCYPSTPAMDTDYSSDEGEAVSGSLQEQGEPLSSEYCYSPCSAALNKPLSSVSLDSSGPGCKRSKATRHHLSPLVPPHHHRPPKNESRVVFSQAYSPTSSQAVSPISPTFASTQLRSPAFESAWDSQIFRPTAASTPSRPHRAYDVHTQGPPPHPVFSRTECPVLSLSSSATSTLDMPSPNSACSSSSNIPGRPRLSHAYASETTIPCKAQLYSDRFPANHFLDPKFVQLYRLNDELGAGGYGFVMTARHRLELCEVAVKFIIKAKVPEHGWMEDNSGRMVPTEALLLGLLDHENIVQCLDLFEDELYFYLVQELHGTPWVPKNKDALPHRQSTAPETLSIFSDLSTPALTPSPSTSSLYRPATPPQLYIEQIADSPAFIDGGSFRHHTDDSCFDPNASSSSSLADCISPAEAAELFASAEKGTSKSGVALGPTSSSHLEPPVRPGVVRRASYDLFECIEQSKHKRLLEDQAKYIFAQVVQAVYYLDRQGVTHCDIKDENILVDSNLKVKLVDFGSAVVADPSSPRPYYTLFFGTTAYAASEILQKKAYRAPPAEIWTLGVLLSYLLTGNSPFPTEKDAIAGRVVMSENSARCLSQGAMELMMRCLEPSPECRASVEEVRGHWWLRGALEYVHDGGGEV